MTRAHEVGETSLVPLAQMVYPGRVLLMGRIADGSRDMIAYALTGRSPSSQARAIVHEANRFRTEVTDPALLRGGNPSLLLYDCIRRCQEHFVVSNGAQTDLLMQVASSLSSTQALSPGSLLHAATQRPYIVEGYAPEQWLDLAMYEPDPPNYTPRISGVMGPEHVAFGSWRRALDASGEGPRAVERSLFETPLVPGKAWMLTTYTGEEVGPGQPLPSLRCEPISLSLANDSAAQLAALVYQALAPVEGGADLRVAVVALSIERAKGRFDYHIINRHEVPK